MQKTEREKQRNDDGGGGGLQDNLQDDSVRPGEIHPEAAHTCGEQEHEYAPVCVKLVYERLPPPYAGVAVHAPPRIVLPLHKVLKVS